MNLFRHLQSATAMRLSALLLCSLGGLPLSQAATPSSGSLSAASAAVSWASDTVVTQIYNPLGSATSCGGTTNTAVCDYFQLSIEAPAQDFQVSIHGVGPTACLCDWDLEVYDPSGQLIAESHNSVYVNESLVLTNPASGTYTVAMVLVSSFGATSYTAGAELTLGTNSSGGGGSDGAPADCAPAASGTLTDANTVDNPLSYLPAGAYALSIDLPLGYRAAHRQRYIQFSFFGANGGGESILAGDATGDALDAVSHWTDGRTAGTDLDRAYMIPSGGSKQATITANAGTSCVQIALVDIADDQGNPNLPFAAQGIGPRFARYTPKNFPGLGLQFAEPTMGVNHKTGKVFSISTIDVLRTSFDDSTNPAQHLWESKPALESAEVSLDPILTVDAETGRVFSLNLAGPISSADYSDDDGETWLPGGNGFPSSGVDHQALEAGPYPEAGIGALIPHPLYRNAVYYCSQGIADAYCSRSDDGGISFKPSTALYTNNECTGLHGHVKVSPDGTVYVPNKACGLDFPTFGNGHPGLIVSEDAGITWKVRTVGTEIANASGSHGDPSVGIGNDNTVYYGYVDSLSGNLKMAVSRDRGETWNNILEVGAIAGVRAVQFPAVVAGDAGRAAVAFVGTAFPDIPRVASSTAGLQLVSAAEGAIDFPGNWYGYIATTLDYGAHWHVTKVAPEDILQGPGGIGGGGDNRNLLDFNDAFVDAEGRVLAVFADGCLGGCQLGYQGNFYGSARVAQIVRQSGGPRMLAAFDPVEPARAGAPRLTGYRTKDYVVLSIDADDGGSAISGYNISRNGQSIASKYGATTYVDATANDAAASYRYTVTALNAQGESAASNEFAPAVDESAPVTADVCTLPGQLWLDQTGEPGSQTPQSDLARMSIAEPEDQDGKLIFTIRAQAPGGSVQLGFDHPDGRRYVINIRPTATTVAYTDGRWFSDSSSTLNNRLLLKPDAPTLDSSSSAGGTFTAVLDKAKWGLNNGDVLRNVTAFGLQANGTGQVFLRDFLGYDISQPIVGNDFCAKGAHLPAPVVDVPPPSNPPPVTPPPPVITPPPTPSGSGGGLPALTLLLLFAAGFRQRRVALKQS